MYATGQQIPTGITVDHLCKVRRCVNPRHLRLLPNHENARRTAGRDWPLGFCAQGHPNDRMALRGSKLVCSVCRAQWDRNYEAKRRAA